MFWAGIKFFFLIFCSCHQNWISRWAVYLSRASIFPVPGGSLGPHATSCFEAIWLMEGPENPYPASNWSVLLKWGNWDWLPHNLPWVPSAYCEPGNCHHPQEDCGYQRHWQGLQESLELDVNNLLIPAQSIIPGSLLQCLGRKTLLLNGFARPSVITVAQVQQRGRTLSPFTVGQTGDMGASLLRRRHGQRTGGWNLMFPLRCFVVWASTMLSGVSFHICKMG